MRPTTATLLLIFAPLIRAGEYVVHALDFDKVTYSPAFGDGGWTQLDAPGGYQGRPGAILLGNPDTRMGTITISPGIPFIAFEYWGWQRSDAGIYEVRIDDIPFDRIDSRNLFATSGDPSVRLKTSPPTRNIVHVIQVYSLNDSRSGTYGEMSFDRMVFITDDGTSSITPPSSSSSSSPLPPSSPSPSSANTGSPSSTQTSSSTISSGGTPTSSPKPESESGGPSKGLSAGDGAAIALGAVLGTLVVVGLVFLYRRRRRQNIRAKAALVEEGKGHGHISSLSLGTLGTSTTTTAPTPESAPLLRPSPSTTPRPDSGVTATSSGRSSQPHAHSQMSSDATMRLGRQGSVIPTAPITPWLSSDVAPSATSPARAHKMALVGVQADAVSAEGADQAVYRIDECGKVMMEAPPPQYWSPRSSHSQG